MRPEDIKLLAAPGAPAMRGDLLLVSVTTPDPDVNAYRGGLLRVPLDGGEARPFTHGFRDSVPTISPDGTLVAFLRATGPQERSQLWVMPVDGGEPRKLTDLPLGAGVPAWAPDSRRIAFVSRVAEAGRYGVKEESGADAPDSGSEAPRWISRLNFRYDDIGFLADRPAQLFLVDVDGGDPVQITSGAPEVSDPVWTPDGTHIVVVANRDWGVTDTLSSDLYAVPANSGPPLLLAVSTGVCFHPVVDGDRIVYFGESTDESKVANNHGLWTIPLRLDGEQGVPTRLTDPETVDCDPGSGRPLATERGVLVVVRNQGALELRLVPTGVERATLAELPLVAGEQAAVKGFAADADRTVCVVSTWDSAGDLVLVGADETRRLTDFSAPLRAAGLRQPVEIKASAPDGYGTHGWLLLPEGEGPHPVVLSVHGGPFMYYGWGFNDEAQVYAAAGYAVVLSNPRGSAGYGQAHGRAIVGALGTVDVDDVLSVLDAAVQRPDLDANRVGVMGGSYGGWMTGWLSAHHGDRFRAAWSERAVNAWDSFVGSSDIGWWFAEAYCGTEPQALHAMSPLTYADRITIPFAVVHSEHDWRCPVEQAQRMFVALRRNGCPAELLLFPGEGHELTRSGQPRHRKQRFDAVLEWWSRHLQ